MAAHRQRLLPNPAASGEGGRGTRRRVGYRRHVDGHGVVGHAVQLAVVHLEGEARIARAAGVRRRNVLEIAGVKLGLRHRLRHAADRRIVQLQLAARRQRDDLHALQRIAGVGEIEVGRGEWVVRVLIGRHRPVRGSGGRGDADELDRDHVAVRPGEAGIFPNILAFTPIKRTRGKGQFDSTENQPEIGLTVKNPVRLAVQEYESWRRLSRLVGKTSNYIIGTVVIEKIKIIRIQRTIGTIQESEFSGVLLHRQGEALDFVGVRRVAVAGRILALDDSWSGR